MMTYTTLSRSLRKAATAGAILLVVLFLVLAGCKKDPPTSIYDLYNGPATSGGTPTVSGITPASGLGGVTVMTLTGTNFSATASQNIVFFNATPATVLQSSPTQLVVRAPILTGDSVKVRVGVRGSEMFSAIRYVKLDPPAIPYTDFKAGEEVTAITSDPTTGLLYASMLSGIGSGVGVKKFTAPDMMSDYAPAFSTTVPRWTGMKLGLGDTIYAVAHRSQVFRIVPATPVTNQVWVTVSGATFDDVDFDANRNLWGAGVAATGEAASVYRIRPDKTNKAFPVSGNFRAVRVFSNFVYVGGTRSGQAGVWRMPILAGDSLGAPQQVLDLASIYPGASYGVSALAFAADGDMYVGTDSPDGILVVHPNGTSEPFYPGIFKPQVVSFAGGQGTYLYAAVAGASVPRVILRIDTQKNGAPYYR